MARWRKRRDERRAPAPYRNEIKNQCPLAPNYAWVGDFTYLPFKGKFLYLATFMDLYTREIVGYHISRRHDKNLVMQAFLDGITNRRLTKPTYLHTDQGAEYTSGDYGKLAEALGVQVSMSKKASPWENGYQESFYNNFKTDLGLEFDRFDHEGHSSWRQYITPYTSTTIKESILLSECPPLNSTPTIFTHCLRKGVLDNTQH